MRRRWWIIALPIVISLLVAIEVVGRRWERPKSTVQIINGGSAVIEDLAVTYGETRMPVGSLPRGQSVQLYITAGPMGRLQLDYRQKNNPIQSFWIDDYDPSQNIQDGYKLVLVVGTGQIQRYAEEDETLEKRTSPWVRFKEWLEAELDPFR